jgi:hypothetical protein
VTEPPAAATTPPAATPPAEPVKLTEPAATTNVWEDPTAAKAEIERLRKENAKDRTDAKTKAAEEARTELAQTIGKALGIVEEETIDPAKLTESLTTSQAEAKQARVELAVFRNADTAGGDPVALLDSTSFLASLAAIDPTDNAAVTAAITSAIEANPRLAVQTAPGMKPNPAQGRSASPPLGVTDQIAAAQKAGDIKAVLRLKSSQVLQNGPSQ